ncbi:MAG: hypothetical protein HKN92_00970 [Chitinophagales bacterium]|nr:hypothetical protein [Chitinophagales bacterium]
MKSGTTALHEYLRSMPEVCMADPKEPFFFECEFDKGLQFYQDKYFSHWASEPIIGESRHQNLYLPFIAERIKATNENSQLIVILRNPVERAYAHWWHWYSRSVEKRKFSDAIQHEYLRINSGKGYDYQDGAKIYCDNLKENGASLYTTYIDTGYYAKQIEKYLALFPREQLLILFTEDLQSDPKSTIDQIRAFLRLDPIEHHWVDKNLKINKHKAKELPDWIRKIAAVSPLKLLNPELKSQLYRSFRNKFFQRPSIDSDTEEMLTKHFSPHNERLTQITSRDLSGWKKPFTPRSVQDAESG